VNGLAAGDTWSDTALYTPGSTGPRTAWVYADRTEVVSEPDETDNIASYAWEIVAGGPPDLIAHVTVTPDPTTAGQTTTLTAEAENIGNGTATQFTLAAWAHLDHVPQYPEYAPYTFTVNSLAPSASVPYVEQFTPNYPGMRTARACADYGDSVTESDETNNCASDPYTIAAAAASGVLAVTSATASPTRAGQVSIAYALSAPADVEVRIRNVAGRLVARLMAGDQRPGASSQTWNGRAYGGARAPGGLYLCEIVARTEDGQAARAVAPVRLGR
jgi:hypothetical protein